MDDVQSNMSEKELAASLQAADISEQNFKKTTLFSLGEGLPKSGLAFRLMTCKFIEDYTGEAFSVFAEQLNDQVQADGKVSLKNQVVIITSLIETWHFVELYKQGVGDQDTEKHLEAQQKREDAILALPIKKALALYHYALAYFSYHLQESEPDYAWLNLKKKRGVLRFLRTKRLSTFSRASGG